VVPTHKKGDKTDCSNFQVMSLLSTSYKSLSNVPFSRLTPYAHESTGDREVLEKNGSIMAQYISYS
jgi:hypothetical protein